MRTDTEKIIAYREAGEVERVHGIRHHGEYSVAKHCYGMLTMLQVIWNDEPEVRTANSYQTLANRKAALVEAILSHDLPERWVGDLPAPVLWDFPNLKAALEGAERKIYVSLDINAPRLSQVDHWWLKALDIGELFLWVVDQLSLGNYRVDVIGEACRKFMNDHWEEIPTEFKEWWEEMGKDLPTWIDEAIRNSGVHTLQASNAPWGEK